jgi:hypothetical protein
MIPGRENIVIQKGYASMPEFGVVTVPVHTVASVSDSNPI